MAIPSTSSTSSGTVLFLDTNGSGFSLNLVLIRDALLRTRPDLALDYLFNDRSKVEGPAAQRAADEVRKRCEAAQHVICATDSLPVGLAAARPGQRRVLVAPPRLALLQPWSGPTGADPPTGYTDVVIHNDRFADGARSRYALPEGGHLISTGVPAIDVFASRAQHDRARRVLLDICPQAEGRTVVTLSSDRSAQRVFANVDPAEFAHSLGDGYFVIASLPGLPALFRDYDAEFADDFFDATGVFMSADFLLMGDIMLTTRFGDAVLFAATGGRLHLIASRATEGGLGAHLPDACALMCLEDVQNLPEALGRPYAREAFASFVATFISPNTDGCTARLVDAVFGGA